MAKKSFVLHTDKFEPLKILSMEQRGLLFTAIYAYECGEELPDMDDMTKMLFMVFKSCLDDSARKYEETCEKRRAAGQKGGLAKASNANQNLANVANASNAKHTDTDTETDTETDTDTDIEVTDVLQSNTPPPRKRKEKVQRHKYGEYENVLLSDEEYQKVKAEYPTDYQVRIDRLSEYMKSTGKSYKDHLATIRAWARKDKDKPQAPARQSYTNSFHNFKERQYDYDALMERIREKNAL